MRYACRLNLCTVLLLLCVLPMPCNAAGLDTTPGGVAYRDLQTGSGDLVNAGDVVTVHLTGWVERQGTQEQAFFSTRQEGRPLKFVVGTDKVLPGWNEGVQGMRVGGRRLLLIPPEQGLGARGFEDAVPANAHLVFIMEVLAVRPASGR